MAKTSMCKKCVSVSFSSRSGDISLLRQQKKNSKQQYQRKRLKELPCGESIEQFHVWGESHSPAELAAWLSSTTGTYRALVPSWPPWSIHLFLSAVEMLSTPLHKKRLTQSQRQWSPHWVLTFNFILGGFTILWQPPFRNYCHFKQRTSILRGSKCHFWLPLSWLQLTGL